MSTNTRVIEAPVERVWDVLADGWLFPLWVVGASRIRDVDATWPQVGARIYHSVGAWPFLLDDTTQVTQADPGHTLSLRARAWPAGEALVEIRLRPAGSGTEVTLEEDAVSGPGALVPAPIRQTMLKRRNDEVLRRLAPLAEGRGR